MSTAPQIDSAQYRSRTASWLLLSVLVLALTALLSLTYPVEETSRRLGDIYFRLRGNQAVSPNVALVLIDDASLSRYGRWPWKRTLLAKVVRAAAAQKPRALGLDILLSEPESEAADRELASTFKAAGNVVLAAKISTSPNEQFWVEPLPLFTANAAAVGHVQAALEPDSICRRVPIRELSTEGPRWAFALELARIARGTQLEDEGHYVKIGDARIPVVGNAATSQSRRLQIELPRFLPIDYHHQNVPGDPSSSFPIVSAMDLLEGRAAGQLQGRAVLIGFGSTEIGDRLSTPVSSRVPMPGVEIHANLVDAILEGRGLQPLGAFGQTGLVLSFVLLSTWAVLHWPRWRGLLFLALLAVAAYASGYFLYLYAHRLTDFGPLVCATILAGPMAQLQNLVFVDRHVTNGLRQLQRTLRRAAPESVGSVSLALHSKTTPQPSDLHWKLNLLSELQTELSALYSFDETLLQAMQEGLAVFSTDGQLIFRNARWQSFCSRQNWDPVASLDQFVAALDSSAWRNLPATLAQPNARLESELHLGGGLWQLRAIRLSASQADSPGLILVVVTDLTAQLERDRARAEALSFVTHELRTPLVSIQGFAEYLLRYPQGAESSEAATTIFRECGRLVAMINTYLNVLRLEAGSRPVHREAFSVMGSVEQVTRVVQPLAQGSGITIKTEIASDLPALQGDPHLVAGALLNLLGNAIKYSPRGSEVKLRVFAEAGNVALEVWNPGPPIPSADLARLFEPFYRGQEEEKSTPGWGIGLAFVKRIAEQHGGHVYASSKSQTGTCFRMLLPSAAVPYCEALT